MNKKRGFTLAELLGVIIILGVLALLVLPIVDRSIIGSKDSLYQAQINTIEEAATNWAAYHMMELPEHEDDYLIVYLWQLKVGGYIANDISDPRNGKSFPNDMEIKITRENNKYVYEVMEGSGTEGNTDIPNIDKPVITLLGDNIINLHINGVYDELGAIATAGDGTDLTNSIEISGDVDTTKEGTYYIKYNVAYNGINAEEVVRTVNVMDKNPAVNLSPNGTHGYNKAITVDVIVTPVEGNTISSLTYKINDGSSQDVVDNQIVLDQNGVYTIEVTAVDNEGHTTIITSNPYYIDTSAPTITFDEGDAGITLKVSEVVAFDLKSGVTVSDNSDTLGVDDVAVSGTLDQIIGEHVITYTVTDEAGNTTTKTRVITVTMDDAVARIGNVTYATLRDAINAVTTTDPTTIVMLKDVTITESETISEDQNITLDLDGYTITNNGNTTMFSIGGTFTLDSVNGGTLNHDSSDYVTFANTGTLTINNGTINSPNTTIVRNNGGTVVTNGGDLIGDYALWNTVSGGVITINDGNFEAQNVVDNDLGTTNINGGTLIAHTYNTIENRDKTVINGGVIKSTAVEDSDGYYWDVIYNKGELVIEDGQFEVSTTSLLYNTGSVTINGGTYSNTGDYYFLWNNSNNAITINDGEFNGNLYMENAYSSSDDLSGSLFINGGNFNHTDANNMIANYDSGTVQIKNATIKSTYTGSDTTYPLIYNTNSGVMTMEVGNNITVGNRVVFSNASSNDFVINGGSYTCDTTEYYCVTNMYGGSLIVNDGTFNNISAIFHNRRGGNIQLKGGEYTLPASYVVINGHTSYSEFVGTVDITGGTYHLNGGRLVSNRVNGNVNVSDVVIDTDTSVYTLLANNYGTSYQSYSGTMTVENCNITSPDSRIFINGGNGTLTINGGVYSAVNQNVVRNDMDGITYVNDATITGRVFNGQSDDGTSVGKIYINGGSISTSVNFAIRNYENGTIEITDTHVVSTAPVDETVREWNAMMSNAVNTDASGTIIIHSGTFESTTTSLLSNRNSGTVIIEDGTFMQDLEKDLEFVIPLSMNYEKSHLIIKSGTLTNTKGTVLSMKSEESAGKVGTDATTLTIGDESATISTTVPKLISYTGYGIYSDIGSVQFYNGSIVGVVPIASTANVTYRTGATYTTGTEIIDGVTLNSAYYE